MPRRKKPYELVSYYVPQNAEAIIRKIVNEHPEFYNHKHTGLWAQKFLYLIDNICDQMMRKDNGLDLNPAVDFLNINQNYTQEMLGVSNMTIAAMFRHLCNRGLLERDGQMKVTVRAGKKVIEQGKSFGYRIPTFEYLVEVMVRDYSQQHKRINELVEKAHRPINPQLAMYKEVMDNVSVVEDALDQITAEVIENKKIKREAEQQCLAHIDELQRDFLKSMFYKRAAKRFYTSQILHRFGKEVSKRLSRQAWHTPFMIPLDEISVPYTLGSLTILKPKQKSILSVKPPAHEETIRTRIKRGIDRLNDKGPVHRKKEFSRVCTAVTSLNREFKKHLLIDGKPLIGLDIRNSQPLIATVIILAYWKDKGDYIPPDVIQYQKDCEAGVFYDHFMEINKIPLHMRSTFKSEFFKRVFFGKILDDDHILKHQFIKKYPGCWEAIQNEKGTELYSETFRDFSKKLQWVEANIMFDGVNVKLMEMGIKAFNIFDSIYVGSVEEYKVAERITMEEFARFGLRPTLNPEFFGRDKQKKWDSF